MTTQILNQMKRVLQITVLALLIALGSSLQQKASAQYSGDVTYQTFYDDLSPYGEWINYPEYGYVWQPDMGADFRPYSSGGHWVWSDEYEWIWASDYDWGWAPFHYGRWFSDPSYGWLWVPGYEWAPAWVVWRSGGDYYGWAPVRPGINISVGFSIGNYNAPYDYWCFAPRNYITSPRIYDYCIDRRQNVNIFNSTVIINNYNYSRNVFVTGPRRNEVEIYTRERIRPVQFRQSSRPGRTEFRNNEVSIYRPNVQQRNNNGFAPRNFERYDRNRVTQNNNNRFDRSDNNGVRRNNNNDTRRSENVNRGNNLPQDRVRNNNPVIERRDNNNDARQPQNNNTGQNDQRRNNQFDRNNNSGLNNNPAPMRRQRPDTRNENRERQFEQRRQEQPQPQPRQLERRSQQQQPRQFERPQSQPRQFEQRRQEQSQQQQPRKFEQRRQEQSQQQQPQNGNGRGNGRGRRGQ